MTVTSSARRNSRFAGNSTCVTRHAQHRARRGRTISRAPHANLRSTRRTP
ncbi:hypothetical protein AB0M95_33415 [Sphaerisporangium sp. NPDC051017]